MINPNFKNVTENLTYILATNILTAIIVFYASTRSNTKATESTIKAFIPTLDKAIAKHTTAITNAIDIKDNKFKKNDSLKIIVDQHPNSKIKPIKDCYISKEEYDSYSNSDKRKIDRVKN